MAFYVGQKVVCINDEHPYKDYPFDVAVKGEIYTVSSIYQSGPDLMLCLYEIYQPDTDDWEAGEMACAFRPVVERKTDISIFKAMLTPKTEQVSA